MSNTSSIEYYKALFVLQGRILEIIDNLDVDFYLTGGTALSRFYLDHRYSDDLDFVSHKDPNFGDYIQTITDTLIDNGFEVKPYGISSTFAALHLIDMGKSKMKLKIDFINEKSIPHFGDVHSFERFSRVDNMRNILSNKISIIPRKEPKDLADIWFICRNLEFKWDEVIEEAGQKRLVEEIFVVECLRSFQVEKFSAIQWLQPVNFSEFEKDREIIAENIITRSNNKLFSMYDSS
jgi:hypothetical protein